MKWIKQMHGSWRDGSAWKGLSIAAGLLSITFVFALHPATSIFGGLFVVLVGWVVPSLLNILVSALMICLLPASFRRPLVLIPTFTIVSFLLAVALEAPVIIQRLVHPPSVQYTVTRSITVPSGWVRPSVVGCTNIPGFPCSSGLYVVANPLARVIYMSGNEGCGCSYWSLADTDPDGTRRSFIDYFADDIKRQMAESRFRIETVPNLSILVAARPHEQDPNWLDLTVEIKDGSSTTATLTELPVPRYPRAFIVSDRAPLLNGHFLAIAIHELTHGTFWSPLLGSRFGYYPRKEMQRFLNEAIHVHPVKERNPFD